MIPREFTEKVQDEFAEVSAKHGGHATISLEMRDGKLWEVGGSWREFQKRDNPEPDAKRNWLTFMGIGDR